MLVAAGLAGCSSEPPSGQPQQQSGTVPVGTAKVSIDGRDASATGTLSCHAIGTVTTLRSGNEDAGVTAVVSSDPALVVQSVSIHNLADFSGSYNEGLGDAAKVTLVGRTYQLSGIADGFDTNSPSFRTSGEFSIQAAC
jgi:hypothetical protein